MTNKLEICDAYRLGVPLADFADSCDADENIIYTLPEEKALTGAQLAAYNPSATAIQKAAWFLETTEAAILECLATGGHYQGFAVRAAS